MKKNIIFRYSYRVINKTPVKKRRVRPLGLLLLVVSAIGAIGLLSFYGSEDARSPGRPVVQASSNTAISDTAPLYDFASVTFPSEGQSAIGTHAGDYVQLSGPEQVRPIASMTKVITALTILDKSPMQLGETGSIITLTTKDEEYYREYVAKSGTVTAVTAGLQMSQYDALQAMLLPSSNNIADTLVDAYFDSREEYLDYANNLLRTYGLENTTVADASGFSPDSVSTPSEMIVVGRVALENQVIAQIVAKPNASIPVGGDIPNYNALIEVEGVTGIKPGLTDEAGHCLLFSATTTDADGNTVKIIGVVMGVFDYPTYITGATELLNASKSIVESTKIP